MKFSFAPFIAVAAALAFPLSGRAQVILSTVAGANTYTQNFNTLPSTGNPAWTDNSTLPGWYATTATTGGFTGQIVATSGANSNFLASFGSSGSADRSLGANPGGENKAWGLRLQNNGSATISLDNIAYRGEMWRQGTNLTAQTVSFSYATSTAPITNLTGNTYTAFAALNFSSPNTTTAADTSVDGNAAGNFVNVTSATSILLAPGSEIMLRFSYPDGAGNDDNLGVDDFVLNYSVAVPEPSTLLSGGLCLVVCAGVLWRRRGAATA